MHIHFIIRNAMSGLSEAFSASTKHLSVLWMLSQGATLARDHIGVFIEIDILGTKPLILAKFYRRQKLCRIFFRFRITHHFQCEVIFN